jgi:hypothetical protein
MPLGREVRGDALDDGRRAVHRRQDADEVARPHPAVRPHKAHGSWHARPRARSPPPAHPAPKPGSRSKSTKVKLWVWTWSPASRVRAATPMTVLYFKTFSPWSIRRAAILWPAGTCARARAPMSASACPSDKSVLATSTLSWGCKRISGLTGGVVCVTAQLFISSLSLSFSISAVSFW